MKRLFFRRVLCLIALCLSCVSCTKEKEQPIESNLTPETLAGTLWVAQEYILDDSSPEFEKKNEPYYIFFMDTERWVRVANRYAPNTYKVYRDIMYLGEVEFRIVQYSADKFELRKIEERYINDKKSDYRNKFVLTRKRGK